MVLAARIEFLLAMLLTIRQAYPRPPQSSFRHGIFMLTVSM
jgi:hypothetical protein